MDACDRNGDRMPHARGAFHHETRRPGRAWGPAPRRPPPRPGTSLVYFLFATFLFAGFFAAFLALAVFSFFDFFAWSAREARA